MKRTRGECVDRMGVERMSVLGSFAGSLYKRVLGGGFEARIEALSAGCWRGWFLVGFRELRKGLA